VNQLLIKQDRETLATGEAVNMSAKVKEHQRESKTSFGDLPPHEIVSMVVNTAVAASQSLPAVMVAKTGNQIAILIDGWTLDPGGNPIAVVANGGKPEVKP
jgi:hypothetical protein